MRTGAARRRALVIGHIVHLEADTRTECEQTRICLGDFNIADTFAFRQIKSKLNLVTKD